MPAIRHHFPIMKKLLLIALLVLAVVAVPVAAFAQYPPAPAVTINPTIVEPGGTITVTGTGFCPNSTVTIRIKDAQGTTVATFTTGANATGSFSTPITVPSNLAAGRYTIETSGTDSGCQTARVLSSNFTVRAAAAAARAPGAAGLVATGADVLPWLLVAIAVIAVGAGFWVYSRRRSVTP